MTLLFFNKPDMHFINKSVLTFCRHLGLRGISLIRSDIIILQRCKDSFHAGINLSLVVAGAETGKEEFQHERRNVGPFLDPMKKILSDNLAVKCGNQLPVEFIQFS